MAVVGIDLSMTSTGVARVENQGKRYHRATTRSVKSKGKRTDTLEDRVARIDHMTAEIVHGITCFDSLVVIESPSYGSAGSGTWDRAGLWWRVVTWLWKHDVAIATMAPTSLKKWISNDGRADKIKVQTYVEGLFPDVVLKTNDEADALALAHVGAVYRELVDIPRQPWQTEEAMAAVKWPALEED